MKKTTTSTHWTSSAKKGTAVKKSAAPKKTSSAVSSSPTAKKTVAPKKTIVKSAPVVAKKSPAPQKKSAPKKSASIKTTPIVEKIVATPAQESSHEAQDGVKMLGILHLVGNFISGGTLGILFVIIYYVFQKEKMSSLEKETCFEIINFNLSFMIYSFVAAISVFLIIGIVLLPVVLVTWLILMLMGFFQHLEGKNYQYPSIIRFFS